MKIGIDARLINETGVGRYIRNLIDQLGKLDQENYYIVFIRKNSFDTFHVPNDRWKKRVAEVPWHTLAEQLIMPWIFLKARLDLVHIPYFNIPILYPGKMVATIHDLTILHFDTGKATTLPLLLYKLRRLGYYIAVAVGLRRVTKLIAVSNTTKQEIIDHFQINPDKIVVTYDGIEDKFKNQNIKLKAQRRIIHEPYFLYVGNAYPHKNLEMLLEGYAQVISITKAKLVFVGKADFFYHRLMNRVEKLGLRDRVMFFGSASDSVLVNLYKHAIALIFPSLMEGFGLSGLEAMAVGTPVLCSDIAVFREVYKDAALFFQPDNADDCAEKLIRISMDVNMRTQLVDRGKLNAANYSWQKLAQITLQTYTNRS